MREADNERAIASFKLAQEAIQVRKDPRLQVISLVSHNFSSSIIRTQFARYSDGTLTRIDLPPKFSQNYAKPCTP